MGIRFFLIFAADFPITTAYQYDVFNASEHDVGDYWLASGGVVARSGSCFVFRKFQASSMWFPWKRYAQEQQQQQQQLFWLSDVT